MKISLILATIRRTTELSLFLDALKIQTNKNFEILIIDQNPDERLCPVLEPYFKCFPIIHLSCGAGLSRARNIGIKQITGDIVAFPDDDCWYPPTLLEFVSNWFSSHLNISGLTGRCVDEANRPLAGRWAWKSGRIMQSSVWSKGVSISIFLRKSLIDCVGYFDEELGVGAPTPWGSGEETDYLIRAIKAGFHIHYCTNLIVRHPKLIQYYDINSIKKAYYYGAGMGRVLKKHKFPFYFFIFILFRSIAQIFVSILRLKPDKAKYHWAVFHGRLKGLSSSSSSL